jgi:DNA-binding GntR family transcriptional regulator
MPADASPTPPGAATDEAVYEPMALVVARRLHERIIDGPLPPGAPIRQEAGAKEFGVGRLPVREALRHLENEGLVVQRPHSGARVAVLDFEECVAIYKIRERLEPLAFSESIEHLSDEQTADVVRAAEQLESLTADHAAWLAADRDFHLACYAGIPTPRLLQMIVSYWNTTQHYRRILLSTFSERDFEIAHGEHLLIVDALLNGEARRGEDILRVAMERSRKRLMQHRELFDR